jgi:hypothetical protein
MLTGLGARIIGFVLAHLPYFHPIAKTRRKGGGTLARWKLRSAVWWRMPRGFPFEKWNSIIVQQTLFLQTYPAISWKYGRSREGFPEKLASTK